jgi:hypothetical protein
LGLSLSIGYLINMNKKRVTKEPYEGYTLPASSEKGGQFVDFKRIIERKPVKVVRRKKDGSNRK